MNMGKNSKESKTFLICLGLAAGVVAVYWPVCLFQFVNYDDGDYVAANTQVQNGLTWSGLIWAFTSRHMGNWHPLTWLSHMLDVELYGMNPGGHHVTSMLLHIASTLLLFGIFRAMTGTLWRSALVACLFALHPLHVESVAWIAERKDVLSGFFWMLTLWAYIKYAQSCQPGGEQVVAHQMATAGQDDPVAGKLRPASVKKPRVLQVTRQALAYYFFGLVFFALGLMAKPMLVTLPFVLLLLDYWPLQRIAQSTNKHRQPTFYLILLEKVPFLLLTVACCAVTYWAQQRGGSVVSLERLSFGVRAANGVVSYVRYIGKTVWPTGLAVFYPYQTWPLWVVAIACATLAGVTVLALWLRKRKPWLVIGWFWFLGTLVPVIGLVQVGLQAMADRYVYVPLIGLAVIAAWGVAELAKTAHKRSIILATLAVLAILGVISSIQVRVWRESETLFRHTLAVTKGNYVAHDGLGFALSQKGRLTEAIEQYEKSLKLKPQNAWAHNNLGTVLAQLGRIPEAIRHFEEATRLQPDFAGAHYNLGNALVQEGRLSEAVAHLATTVRIEPDSAKAHFSLGTTLLQLGKLTEAIYHLERTIALAPNLTDAHNHLGVALIGQGRVSEAITHYQQALQLNPGDADAHYNLGNAFVRLGRHADAILHYQHAVQLKPQDFKAHNNLANVLSQLGRLQEAIDHYEQALELKPDYADALNNLSRAWLRMQQPSNAVRYAERACELASNSVAIYLDTLAVAYSEAGRLEDAAQAAERGVAAARAAGDKQLAQDIEARLRLYRERLPHNSTSKK